MTPFDFRVELKCQCHFDILLSTVPLLLSFDLRPDFLHKNKYCLCISNIAWNIRHVKDLGLTCFINISCFTLCSFVKRRYWYVLLIQKTWRNFYKLPHYKPTIPSFMMYLIHVSILYYKLHVHVFPSGGSQLQLFVSKLTGTQVGFTAAGLLNITKEFILSVNLPFSTIWLRPKCSVYMVTRAFTALIFISLLIL